METKEKSVASSQIVTPAERTLELVPDPARTVVALSRLGYDGLRATGDIVDNSMEAGAKYINVILSCSRNRGCEIEVLDDGCGIGAEAREEVFRIGSKTGHKYRRGSWSKYGLGMKTASWSLGKRLTLITKTADDVSPFVLVLDVDTIIGSDRWVGSIRAATASEAADFSRQVGDHGTHLTIDKLSLDEKEVKQLEKKLPHHLGLTYGKVLAPLADEGDSSSTDGRVRVLVNGKQVAPFDPLHRADREFVTVLLPKTEVLIETTDEKKVRVYVSATHLMHPDVLRLKDPERARLYRYKLPNQGIYVYREQRLIASAETLDIFTKDGHLNSFRGELEFKDDGDEHFALDIAKSKIVLTQAAKDRLHEVLRPAINASDQMWRSARTTAPSEERELHETASELIESKERAMPDLPPQVAAPVSAPKDRTAKIAESQPIESVVAPVPDLPCDVLWEPAYEDGTAGVRMNTSHPFYRELFPVLKEMAENKRPEAFRLIDQFFYALARAELQVASQETRQTFIEFRNFVSMFLRTLIDQ